jgi:hypothetical protein
MLGRQDALGMIVFCEECGEKYILEPEEVEGVEKYFIICRICKDIISVPLQAKQEKKHVSAKGKKK